MIHHHFLQHAGDDGNHAARRPPRRRRRLGRRHHSAAPAVAGREPAQLLGHRLPSSALHAAARRAHPHDGAHAGHGSSAHPGAAGHRDARPPRPGVARRPAALARPCAHAAQPRCARTCRQHRRTTARCTCTRSASARSCAVAVPTCCSFSLSRSASPASSPPPPTPTAMVYAFALSFVVAVRVLLQAGADPQPRDGPPVRRADLVQRRLIHPAPATLGPPTGGVAQLAERINRTVEARGSIPLTSTRMFEALPLGQGFVRCVGPTRYSLAGPLNAGGRFSRWPGAGPRPRRGRRSRRTRRRGCASKIGPAWRYQWFRVCFVQTDGRLAPCLASLRRPLPEHRVCTWSSSTHSDTRPMRSASSPVSVSQVSR